MSEGILTGVRVVELAGGHAVSVTGLLLAEAGAEVLKIEATPGARGTASFAVWNRSKKSVELDVEGCEGRSAVEALIASSDVFLTDWDMPRLSAAGLDEAALVSRHAHLVYVSIGSWPRAHPKANRPVDDAIVLAEAGLMDEQRGVREGPVYLRFPLGSWGAAYLSAIGAVARLVQRGRGHGAGSVSTSLLQGALLPTAMLWRRAERTTQSLIDSMGKAMQSPQFECSDGVWIHVKAPPDDAPLMRTALDALGAERVAELNKGWPSNHTCINWGANAYIFKTRPSAEWLADLWAADIPVQADAPMGAIYADAQAIANGYVVDVLDHDLGLTKQPGVPCSVEPPMAVRWGAPRFGSTSLLQLDLSPRPGAARGDHVFPLAGLRVADFGSFVAGPLAPMILADLGADVVKIEGTGGDVLRRVEGAFLGAQRGKRSLALDLKSSASAAVVKRLVDWADIVHHNIRMPAAERIGLSATQIRAMKPEGIFCHVSSYGPVGPRKDWPGYDQLFQAQSGWEYEGAGEGNPPMWHRFGMMDHQAALASAFAMVLALYRRDRTGEGQSVATSILGASMLTVSETVKLDDGCLSPFHRLDAQQMGVGPQKRLYEVSDGWILLAADDPEILASFMSILGVPNAADLELQLKDHEARDVLAIAAKAGAWAVRAHCDHRDAFFDDLDNRDTGIVHAYRHGRLGKLELPGAFLHLGTMPAVAPMPPPDIGEHSLEVLSEIGISPAEIAMLVSGNAVKANTPAIGASDRAPAAA